MDEKERNNKRNRGREREINSERGDDPIDDSSRDVVLTRQEKRGSPTEVEKNNKKIKRQNVFLASKFPKR